MMFESTEMVDGDEKRRPIKARSLHVFKRLARFLKENGVTPNQVSLASMGCALIAGIGIVCSSSGSVFVFIGIFGILTRLICNLIDGMIAVEGGLSSPTGEIYNEAPDRVSDTIVFLAFGLALERTAYLSAGMGMGLGMLASLLAISTAYIRLLGVSCGSKPYFSGPMAKQHRMAVSMLTLISVLFFPSGSAQLFLGCLALIGLGSALTVFRRLRLVSGELNGLSQVH